MINLNTNPNNASVRVRVHVRALPFMHGAYSVGSKITSPNDKTSEPDSTFRGHRHCDLRNYSRHRRNDRGFHGQFSRHSLHASHALDFNGHNRLVLQSWGTILSNHEKMGLG